MKPGSGWPLGIAAVLTATVVGNLVMMRIAGSDPSFAVEPDYYRKAVAYDSTMAQARTNVALGWNTNASIIANAAGVPVLHVHLTDSTGLSLSDASVTAVAMYVGRAGEPDTLTLTPGDSGEYSAPLVHHHAGQWEVRLSAKRGTDHFTSSARVEAPVIVSSLDHPVQ